MRNFLRHSLLLVLALLMAVPLPALALLWEGNEAGRFYEVGADGEAIYYHYDNVGSTIALSNDAGLAIERMEYEPYGTLVHRAREAGFEGALHDTAYLFAGFYGYQTDSSGLVYLRERYYNPLTRRFINPDPAREGWNWYAYAGGDPMGFVDPSGLGTESVLDAVQTGLSALGMMPIVGAAFDILNAGISFVSGQHVAALMNLASAVPGLGDAFAAGKMALGGAKMAAASFGAGMAAFGKVGGGTVSKGLSRSTIVSAERAEQLLVRYGQSPAQAKDFIASFNGPITARIASPGESFLRYTDVANSKGSFLTKAVFESPKDAVKGLYLKPYGNRASLVQVVVSSKRSIVLEGGIANGTLPNSL